MLRRRCTPLTRLVLTAAFGALAEEERPDVRTVFASRHGSINESIELIHSVVRGERISPTKFSHTVHNAQAGLFCIAAGNRQASSSLAARADTFACGWLEALTHLEREPERPVLLRDERRAARSHLRRADHGAAGCLRPRPAARARGRWPRLRLRSRRPRSRGRAALARRGGVPALPAGGRGSASSSAASAGHAPALDAATGDEAAAAGCVRRRPGRSRPRRAARGHARRTHPAAPYPVVRRGVTSRGVLRRRHPQLGALLADPVERAPALRGVLGRQQRAERAIEEAGAVVAEPGLAHQELDAQAGERRRPDEEARVARPALRRAQRTPARRARPPARRTARAKATLALRQYGPMKSGAKGSRVSAACRRIEPPPRSEPRKSPHSIASMAAGTSCTKRTSPLANASAASASGRSAARGRDRGRCAAPTRRSSRGRRRGSRPRPRARRTPRPPARRRAGSRSPRAFRRPRGRA